MLGVSSEMELRSFETEAASNKADMWVRWIALMPSWAEDHGYYAFAALGRHGSLKSRGSGEDGDEQEESEQKGGQKDGMISGIACLLTTRQEEWKGGGNGNAHVFKVSLLIYQTTLPFISLGRPVSKHTPLECLSAGNSPNKNQGNVTTKGS